ADGRTDRIRTELTPAASAGRAKTSPGCEGKSGSMDSDTATMNRPELLQVADAVARDKSIDRLEVLEAMEQAIQKAGRAKYGAEHDIRARIDPKTGDIPLARYLEVVEEVED